MTAFGCTCAEMRYEETQPASTGKGRVSEYTGKLVRIRPERVPLHNCEYVRARERLIPIAWHVAGKRSRDNDQRTRIFHEEMERLVAELYKKGGI